MWVKICGWNDPAVLRDALAKSCPDAIASISLRSRSEL